MIRLSLIIPTHNRSASLLRTLHSVAQQSHPASEWECIVVDNNCVDDTAGRFAEFVALHPSLNLRIVSEREAGASAARNRGVREAQGAVLAFVDDDERINEEFIASYIALFDADPKALVAGGRIVAEYPTIRPRWMSRYVEMPIANPKDFGAQSKFFPKGQIPGAGNIAFRAELKGIIPLFDPTLGRIDGRLIGGEENDLCERVLALGERIRYAHRAVIWHIIEDDKLNDGYFKRLCYNVGVSQKLLARKKGSYCKAMAKEALKWVATLALCVVHRPVQSKWLLKMRWSITRGLLS